MVMRLTGYSRAAFGTDFTRRQIVYQMSEPALPQSTSLIVRPARPAPLPAPDGARPEVPFLAQLLAKAENMPASRTRRRADPTEGARAYGAAADLGRPRRGKSLRLV
jgi:hypothetical protein